jgi:hypothetical protein
MAAFIDAHRDTYGVEPICAVWPIAPSTYYNCQRSPHSEPPRPGKQSHRGSPKLSQAGSPMLSHPGAAMVSPPGGT